MWFHQPQSVRDGVLSAPLLRVALDALEDLSANEMRDWGAN